MSRQILEHLGHLIDSPDIQRRWHFTARSLLCGRFDSSGCLSVWFTFYCNFFCWQAIGAATEPRFRPGRSVR